MTLDLDSLHSSDGADNDLIDSYYTGRLWNGGLPDGQILTGRIQQQATPTSTQEDVTKQNLYVVRTTQGHLIPDCICLSPASYGSSTKNTFSATKQPGVYSKPYTGAFCVVATSNGGAAYIIGYFNPPTTARLDDDGTTTDSNPGSADDVDAQTQGDHIIRSENSIFNMKRLGAILVESGASIRQTMNPSDGTYFTQAKRRTDVSEGYMLARSRIDENQPETLSTEDFFDKLLQRGSKSTRVRIKNGKVDSSAVRELTVTEVNFVTPASPIETIKARERYFSDGSWVAEGPEFRWGGSLADEPVVLGNALVAVIKELSRIIKGIKVSTAWGPSGTPLPPTPTDLVTLENDIDKILSDYMFATKKPAIPTAL